MIKIDKKVPIPNGLGQYGQKYPFAQMKVGDSFLFPTSKRNTANSNAYAWAKKTGWKFIVRKTPQGLRCWRIK